MTPKREHRDHLQNIEAARNLDPKVFEMGIKPSKVQFKTSDNIIKTYNGYADLVLPILSN